MIRTILIPLDGTPRAERALQCAGCLAERFGAEVILLHVLEESPSAHVHGEPHLVDAEEAERYLEQAAARFIPTGVSYRTHVHRERTRHVAASIAVHDQEFACDLIVISPHGPSGWRSWMEGNIPQRIARKIETPVLIVREAVCQGSCLFRNILVPDDASPAHEGDWDICIDLARACGASLRLVSAVETPDTLGGVGAASATFLPRSTELVLELAGQEAARHLDLHVAQLAQAGLSATMQICRGNPFDVICGALKEGQADLLVLRTHRRAGLEAWFSGSLTARLLREVRTSVLLIPL